MMQQALRDELRDRLMKLAINESFILPLRNKSTVSYAIADLRMFNGLNFKVHHDKTRQELVIKRIV